MIRYYEERYGTDKPIAQAITLGGGANMPGLTEYLTAALRLPVRHCEPWQYFRIGKLDQPSKADKPMYATAAGLSADQSERGASAMINLLPPDIKEDYRYGLHNTVLLRWVAAFFVALIGSGLIATYGLVSMQNSSKDYSTKVAQAKTELQQENLGGTEAQVKDITSNLKLVVQVLSKEVLFSKLLKQVATVIPRNAVLKNLDISQTTGAIDISADAVDYQTATQVQINLQDPANKIFSKADIVGITCNATSGDSAYPCTVQIRALFASNNPYLFVNKGSS